MNVAANLPRTVSLAVLGATFEPSASWPDVPITGLALDSRTVKPGDGFFALSGTRNSGLAYVGEAVARGARVVFVDSEEAVPALPVPVVRIPGIRTKVGMIASRYFGEPSRNLQVIAVTGTNGKTTVAHLCAQAINHAGRRSGYIGTLGNGELGNLCATGLTTPDPIQLQRAMAAMTQSGCDAVALEASSHALSQSRLAGTLVHTAIFTGLGHDHLDYHHDLDAYFKAKKSLFMREGLAHAVLNADDPMSGAIADDLPNGVSVTWFSLRCDHAGKVGATHLKLTKATYTPQSSVLHIDANGKHLRLETPLIGDVNAQNVLAVLGALMSISIPVDEAAAALSAVQPVPGRLERVGQRREIPTVFVDYAHSPDSLERVLKILRDFKPRRLHCVFGCGGDRDRTKRPLMGRIAASFADHIIVTNDNPRSEDPAAIAREIIAGAADPARFTVIYARDQAIFTALDAARAEDIVLIAGKGHETTQELAGTRIEQSDQATVRDWLERRR